MEHSKQISPDAPAPNAAACWESVDAVVCINLDKRVDRWEAFCREVQGLIPADKLHRVSAVAGVELPGYGEAPWFTERTGERSRYWAGVAGCTLSHRRVLEMAQQRGWRNILIFEDDIAPEVTSDGLAMLDYALRTLQGSYMLYLGYGSRVPHGRCIHREGSSALWKISGVLQTHAYLVSQGMYEPLLRALPTSAEDVWEWVSCHRAVDTFYCEEVAAWAGVGVYAILPFLFCQSGMSSDLVEDSAPTKQPQATPTELKGLSRWVHGLLHPLRRLKWHLNSYRTHRRALRGGFPGFRRKRPPQA